MQLNSTSRYNSRAAVFATSNQIVGVDAWKSVLFLRARIVWTRIFTKF